MPRLNGHINDPLDPPFDITANQLSHILHELQAEFINNASLSRQDWVNRDHSKRTDIDKECGYPLFFSAEDYQDLFDREPIPNRVVEVFPKETWQVQPSVYEDENPDKITPFENDWDAIGKSIRGEEDYYEDEEGNPIWEYLLRADILSGIGQYGIIMLGLNDGLDLSMPAKGVQEYNSAPMELPKESSDTPRTPKDLLKFKPSTNTIYNLTMNQEGVNNNLLFMRVFPEALAPANAFESNPTSPRFGHPTSYNVTFHDPRIQTSGSSIGLAAASYQVHWSRVVHIADNLESSEIFGKQRMKPVLPRLLDLRKLYGGSAEMYWQGALPGIHFSNNPSAGPVKELTSPQISKFKDQIEQYFTRLQRWMYNKNMTATNLSPTVVDPTPQIQVQIAAICIKLGIPVRVFMGSERGELASSQDDAAWNDRLRHRQKFYVSPRIIRPVVNRLISLKILTKPKQFRIWWPDLSSQTEQDRADIATKKTSALVQYSSSGSSLITPIDFLTRFLHFSEQEAQAIIDNSIKAQEPDSDTPISPMFGMTAGVSAMKELFTLFKDGAIGEDSLKQMLMLFFQVTDKMAEDIIADGLPEPPAPPPGTVVPGTVPGKAPGTPGAAPPGPNGKPQPAQAGQSPVGTAKAPKAGEKAQAGAKDGEKAGAKESAKATANLVANLNGMPLPIKMPDCRLEDFEYVVTNIQDVPPGHRLVVVNHSDSLDPVVGILPVAPLKEFYEMSKLLFKAINHEPTTNEVVEMYKAVVGHRPSQSEIVNTFSGKGEDKTKEKPTLTANLDGMALPIKMVDCEFKDFGYVVNSIKDVPPGHRLAILNNPDINEPVIGILPVAPLEEFYGMSKILFKAVDHEPTVNDIVELYEEVLGHRPSTHEIKHFTENVFCPTGPGGGIDATCSPGGAGKGGSTGGKGTSKGSGSAVSGEPKTAPPPGKTYNPDVHHDANRDGITDAARVGVPAHEVPPPPKLTKLPNLTKEERRAEKAFMDRFHANPDGMAKEYTANVLKGTKPGDPPKFETDEVKGLMAEWNHPDLNVRSQNRAIYNTALHGTANAIAKRAFVQHLDTMSPGEEILVTVGGCGAGKGHALKETPEGKALKARSKVVWDSAGDQNATENPWIQAEAEKRGLKVNYAFVHADPTRSWDHPERGVVARASKPTDGRMVDAKVFADSYAIGVKNHQKFYDKEKDNPNASFTFLDNTGVPKLIQGIPSSALKYNSKDLAEFAADIAASQGIPPHIKRGATIGYRIWPE